MTLGDVVLVLDTEMSIVIGGGYGKCFDQSDQSVHLWVKYRIIVFFKGCLYCVVTTDLVILLYIK